VVTSSLQYLEALDTSTSLESRPAIASGLVVLIVLDIFEIMSPETEGPSAGRFANIIVARVLNGET
jgi:hypothetical protein